MSGSSCEPSGLGDGQQEGAQEGRSLANTGEVQAMTSEVRGQRQEGPPGIQST